MNHLEFEHELCMPILYIMSNDKCFGLYGEFFTSFSSSKLDDIGNLNKCNNSDMFYIDLYKREDIWGNK